MMRGGTPRPAVGWRRGSVWCGLAVLPAFLGCPLFSEVNDTFEGLTNPLVAQGLVLSIDGPPSSVDLPSVGLFEGASATVFLADAADVSELAQVPVREAEVRLTGTSIGTVIASEVFPGTYLATPNDGLAYFEGELLELRVAIGGGSSWAGLDLPVAPVLTLPGIHPAGTDLVIDLTGQGFDANLVVVFGPAGLAYSNVPGGIDELHAFTSSVGNPVLPIPGSTLTQPGSYTVGVAGLVNTGASDLDNMNTALSNLGAARMVFASVSVQ